MGASYINAILIENSADFQQAFTFKFLSELLVDADVPAMYKKQLSRSLVHVLERSDQGNLQLYLETVGLYQQLTYSIF